MHVHRDLTSQSCTILGFDVVWLKLNDMYQSFIYLSYMQSLITWLAIWLANFGLAPLCQLERRVADKASGRCCGAGRIRGCPIESLGSLPGKLVSSFCFRDAYRMLEEHHGSLMWTSFQSSLPGKSNVHTQAEWVVNKSWPCSFLFVPFWGFANFQVAKESLSRQQKVYGYIRQSEASSNDLQPSRPRKADLVTGCGMLWVSSIGFFHRLPCGRSRRSSPRTWSRSVVS